MILFHALNKAGIKSTNTNRPSDKRIFSTLPHTKYITKQIIRQWHANSAQAEATNGTAYWHVPIGPWNGVPTYNVLSFNWVPNCLLPSGCVECGQNANTQKMWTRQPICTANCHKVSTNIWLAYSSTVDLRTCLFTAYLTMPFQRHWLSSAEQWGYLSMTKWKKCN